MPRPGEHHRDAVFVGGSDSLVSYLKGALLPHIVPGMGWLKPPVVEFTVGTHGEAANVALVATSGHAGLDEQPGTPGEHPQLPGQGDRRGSGRRRQT
jgi:hypothetical protein